MNTFKKLSLFEYISIALLLLLLIQIAFVTPLQVRSIVQNIEAEKVGGEDNYAIMQEIFASDTFRSNQKQSLETAKQQMVGGQANAPQGEINPPHGQPGHKEDGDTTSPTANAIQKISLDEIKKIKADSIIMGDKNAKILIVEYSDLQCPYCKRHFENGTLNTLVAKYNGKVAKTMRHFPLGFHQYAPKAAEGMECFANGNVDKYFAYAGAIFAKDINTNGSPTTIFEVNKELGGSEDTFKKCVESGKYTQKVADQMAEGARLFGISGTPGNVLINTESGEFVVLAGAYPSSGFETVINNWLQ